MSVAPDPVFEFAMAAVIRGGDPDWSAADAAELECWRRADPAHAAALARARALWARFDGVAPAWERMQQDRPERSRRAALGAVAGLGLLALAGPRLLGPGLLADYRTGPGESRALSLPDGSAVELGARSALDLGGTARAVTLDEGEAFFRIRPAPQPFTVQALGARIEAPAGAAADFALRAVRRQGLVAATRGSLLLSLHGQPPLRVAAGREARFSARAAGAATVSAPGSVAPWRQGRLVFADAPLAEVVAELGRYRPGRVLTDPRVGAMRITAVFDTADIAGAFDSLGHSLPLRIVETRLGLLVLAG
ncbi:MAG: FecR domain-containing protein [Paracoccus aminovorans]|nr:FecR domain-containing protein [Paracoccus aminovorans]